MKEGEFIPHGWAKAEKEQEPKVETLDQGIWRLKVSEAEPIMTVEKLNPFPNHKASLLKLAFLAEADENHALPVDQSTMEVISGRLEHQ